MCIGSDERSTIRTSDSPLVVPREDPAAACFARGVDASAIGKGDTIAKDLNGPARSCAAHRLYAACDAREVARLDRDTAALRTVGAYGRTRVDDRFFLRGQDHSGALHARAGGANVARMTQGAASIDAPLPPRWCRDSARCRRREPLTHAWSSARDRDAGPAAATPRRSRSDQPRVSLTVPTALCRWPHGSRLLAQDPVAPHSN